MRHKICWDSIEKDVNRLNASGITADRFIRYYLNDTKTWNELILYGLFTTKWVKTNARLKICSHRTPSSCNTPRIRALFSIKNSLINFKYPNAIRHAESNNYAQSSSINRTKQLQTICAIFLLITIFLSAQFVIRIAFFRRKKKIIIFSFDQCQQHPIKTFITVEANKTVQNMCAIDCALFTLCS